jgi:hypothetical protein
MKESPQKSSKKWNLKIDLTKISESDDYDEGCFDAEDDELTPMRIAISPVVAAPKTENSPKAQSYKAFAKRIEPDGKQILQAIGAAFNVGYNDTKGADQPSKVLAGMSLEEFVNSEDF